VCAPQDVYTEFNIWMGEFQYSSRNVTGDELTNFDTEAENLLKLKAGNNKLPLHIH
jgi:hypothetical protein